MRTNIEIDDQLMNFVMATGDFKTKREAVEAGLKLIKRRKAYDALLAARGTLLWDDSDEAWARRRAELVAEDTAQEATDADTTESLRELAVHEPVAVYKAAKPSSDKTARKPRTPKSRTASAAKGTAA